MVFNRIFLPGGKLVSIYFSTYIVLFLLSFGFVVEFYFGIGSLNVKVKLYSYICIYIVYM